MWREDYVMDFVIFSPEHFTGIQQYLFIYLFIYLLVNLSIQ